MKNRRIGRFFARYELVDADDLRLVMTACSVVRCELLGAGDVFVYEAISPHFDLLSVGEVIPTYTWIFERAEPLGQITIRGVRREKFYDPGLGV